MPDPNEFTLDGPLAQTAGDLLEEMPEVSQHAIDQHFESEKDQTAATASAETSPPNSSTVESPNAGKVDKAGIVFDPEKHTGSLLKSGLWRERKAKISGSKVASPDAKSVAQTQTPDDAACKAAGLMTAQLIVGVSQMVGGEEFAPDDANEMNVMAEAWGIYYTSKGIRDIPPGVAVTAIMLGYYAKRFTRPKTQAKLSRCRAWIAIRIAKWKLKKEFKARGINAHVSIQDGVLMVDGKKLEN